MASALVSTDSLVLVSKAQQQDSILSTFGFNANSAAHVTVKSQFELGLTQVCYQMQGT
jgi:hypothetical protein